MCKYNSESLELLESGLNGPESTKQVIKPSASAIKCYHFPIVRSMYEEVTPIQISPINKNAKMRHLHCTDLYDTKLIAICSRTIQWSKLI